MPHQIAFAEDLGLMVLRLSGDVTPDEVERAMDEMPAQPWFRAHLKLIVDARQCTTAMTGKDVQRIADYAKNLDSTWGETKWAILASSDVIYGLSRMYMALTASCQVDTYVFRSPNDADDWLELGVDMEEALRRAAKE